MFLLNSYDAYNFHCEMDRCGTKFRGQQNISPTGNFSAYWEQDRMKFAGKKATEP